MQASSDTAMQCCEGGEIMHKGVRYANDSLCMGQAYGSEMRWGRGLWCGRENVAVGVACCSAFNELDELLLYQLYHR